MKQIKLKNYKFTVEKVLCLTLLTLTVFSSYFLAKYVSDFRGASDTSVAKWSVEYDSDGNTLNLVSGNVAGDYTLDITSTSEVSASYSVILSSVPAGMEIKIDNGLYQTADASGVVSFNNVGSFTANDINDTHTHIITFNSPLGSNMPSTNRVDVDVRFVQND